MSTEHAEPQPVSPAGTAPLPKSRRASIAGGVGTLIEYYDFSVYAFLAVTIGPLFFPDTDPAVATISAMLVFASSYVMRPLGGWFFGHLGDRRGRRFALVATILSMGITCALMGLLPTHAQWGVGATITLVVVRLVQGFAAGGEIGGAATYIAESATPGKRGFYGAATAMGASGGFAVAAAVVGTVRIFLDEQQMDSFGWRIPFLISVVLLVVSLWLRLQIEDTPEFNKVEQTEAGVDRIPLLTVLRDHPLSVLRVAGLSIALNGVGYIGLTYFPIFLQQHGFNPAGVAWTAALCIGLAVLTYPLAGKLSDRFDRRPVLTASYLVFIVIAWPAFAVLGSTTSLAVVAVVYFVFMFFSGWSQVPSWALSTELFPSKVRYSGVALGYNLGTIVAGGTAPVVAAWLVQSTGRDTSPALWIMAVSFVGLITMIKLAPTAKKPLPTL